jgi:ribose transport system ATP-binding protein
LLLELAGVGKRFPGAIALDAVDFDLRPGEVHVLLGENGAGKSTLINIMAGTFAPDSGQFRFQGREVTHLTPHRARLMGISPVFQEFSLIPELTVEQNLFLGREMTAGPLLRRDAMRGRAVELLADLGFDLRPGVKAGRLSRAHQQMAEIAKALLAETRVLILDEPTASLTEAEVDRLFELLARLKAQGVGIIYVSHRMAEIRRIADRVTILRDGRRVATVAASEATDTSLVELMTGRRIDMLFPTIIARPAATVLEIEGLTLADGSVRDASLFARAGEITGIAGLVGSGKSELIRAVYGLAYVAAGSIRLRGKPFDAPSPATALDAGVCYFPSDRGAEGLAVERPVRENASMAALDLARLSRFGLLRRAAERSLVRNVMERLSLRPLETERRVRAFSGGNRQKVLLARGLMRDISLFLFDEPTVGIDVGAKLEVYALMKDLAEAGAAIVLVSSELPEVMNLSNRLYVMHRSHIVAELAGEAMTEHTVLGHFFSEAA